MMFLTNFNAQVQNPKFEELKESLIWSMDQFRTAVNDEARIDKLLKGLKEKVKDLVL